MNPAQGGGPPGPPIPPMPGMGGPRGPPAGMGFPPPMMDDGWMKGKGKGDMGKAGKGLGKGMPKGPGDAMPDFGPGGQYSHPPWGEKGAGSLGPPIPPPTGGPPPGPPMGIPGPPPPPPWQQSPPPGASGSPAPGPEDQLLPGGYRIGDGVVSRIAHASGAETLKVGDKGTVVGVATQDPHTRIRCKFPNMASVNILATQVDREKPGASEAAAGKDEGEEIDAPPEAVAAAWRHYKAFLAVQRQAGPPDLGPDGQHQPMWGQYYKALADHYGKTVGKPPPSESPKAKPRAASPGSVPPPANGPKPVPSGPGGTKSAAEIAAALEKARAAASATNQAVNKQEAQKPFRSPGGPSGGFSMDPATQQQQQQQMMMMMNMMMQGKGKGGPGGPGGPPKLRGTVDMQSGPLAYIANPDTGDRACFVKDVSDAAGPNLDLLAFPELANGDQVLFTSRPRPGPPAVMQVWRASPDGSEGPEVQGRPGMGPGGGKGMVMPDGMPPPPGVMEMVKGGMEPPHKMQRME